MACLQPIGNNPSISDPDSTFDVHSNSCVDQHLHYPEKCPLCAFDTLDIPAVDANMKTLLTTNNAPDSTINLPLIASNLERILPLSDDIGKWISTVQTALVSMQNAKAIVDLTILRHKGALHPIRSVPDDVLLTIFEWCIPFGANSLHSSNAPWTLTLVSRRWRALALTSPRLWSNIHIYFPGEDPVEYPDTTRLNILLSRTALCDLSVHVTARNRKEREDYYGLEDDTFIQDCIVRLQPTAARWRKLELNEVIYGMLAPLNASTFDRLTDLSLKFRENVDEEDDVLWLNVPRLSSVSLYRQPCPVEIPWDKITSYACDEDGLQHLPQCTSLEELWLEYAMLYQTAQLKDVGVSMPITLPALHSIYFVEPKTLYGSPYCILELSEMLVLPSLNLLSLTFNSLKMTFPTFHGAIHHIKRLVLRYLSPCFDDTGPLLTFLGECSSVTDLFLDEGVADDAVLAALLVDEDNSRPVLLPRLTCLRLEDDLLEAFPSEIMDMVLSRCNPGRRDARSLTQLKIMVDESLSRWETEWKKGLGMAPEDMAKWELIIERIEVTRIDEDDVFPTLP